MNDLECYFGEAKRDDGVYQCLNPGCGRVMRGPFEPWQFHAPCRSGKPAPERVGSHLMQLTAELGIKPKSGCSCGALAREMDRWGVVGCQEHRAEILAKLKENYRLYGRFDKLTAAANAVASGLVFKIDPFRPLESLLDLAIQGAQQSHNHPA